MHFENCENKYLVSVIVPVYNVSNYLKKCLDSLVCQTMRDIEIILVDDGSTDSSGEICDYYERKYSNIKVIHRENGGLGMARNSGLEVATGDFVGFVDSDDYVSYQMFEKLYCNAIENDADISYGNMCRFVQEDTLNQYEGNVCKEIKTWQGEKEIRQYLLDRIGLPPESINDNFHGANVCSGLFRLDLIRKNNIKFVSERVFIAEDILFDIDIIPFCRKIVHTNELLYYYRYNPKSLTTVYKQNRFKKNVDLYHEMYRRLLYKYSEDECFNSMSRYLLTVARNAIIQESCFIKTNGIKHAIRMVKLVCNTKELQEVLKKYNYKRLPAKYRYLCFLEKRKAYRLIVALVFLFYTKRL